ncbi:MAG: nuclear transport factor 2 family protein [Pseudomonadota bacterium]
MQPSDTLSAYAAQINLHDFDLLVPLICEDAIFWFNDGSHTGLAQVRQAFEKTWQSFPLEAYWLEDLHWFAVGPAVAACTYSFCWKAKINGEVVAGGGRGTNVLRSGPGGWKIAHEHLSQFPQTPK